MIVLWWRTQASSPKWQDVADDRANDDRVRSAVAYSAIEWTRAKVVVRSVVSPEPQPQPVSCLKGLTRDVSFLRNDSRCGRHVSVLSNVTARYLGSERIGRVWLF